MGTMREILRHLNRLGAGQAIEKPARPNHLAAVAKGVANAGYLQTAEAAPKKVSTGSQSDDEPDEFEGC